VIFVAYKPIRGAAGLLLLVSTQLPLEEPSECEPVHLSFNP